MKITVWYLFYVTDPVGAYATLYVVLINYIPRGLPIMWKGVTLTVRTVLQRAVPSCASRLFCVYNI